MKFLAKENTLIYVLTLAFFMSFFFGFGVYYGESTDSFWVNVLIQQGIDLPNNYYTLISDFLIPLQKGVGGVNWNTLLMYCMLFIISVVYLQQSKNKSVAFSLLLLCCLADTVMLFDFTQVSISIGVLGSFLVIDNKDKRMAFWAGIIAIVFMVLIRPVNIYYLALLLVPLLVLNFRKKHVRVFSLLLTVVWLIVLTVSISDHSDAKRLNRARVKMVDYQVSFSAEELRSFTGLDIIRSGLPVSLVDVEPSLDLVESKSVFLDFDGVKALKQVLWLIKRGVVSLFVLIGGLLLLFFSVKGGSKWFLGLFFIFVPLFFSVFFKFPDRLFAPLLLTVFLTLSYYRKMDKSIFTIGICVLFFVASMIRAGVKSSNLKEQQIDNAKRVQNAEFPSTRLFAYNQGVSFKALNPFEVHLSNGCSLLPLGGWLGGHVSGCNAEGVLYWLSGKDVDLFERALKINVIKVNGKKLYKKQKAPHK